MKDMMKAIMDMHHSLTFLSNKFDEMLLENAELKKLLKENTGTVKKVQVNKVSSLQSKINILE